MGMPVWVVNLIKRAFRGIFTLARMTRVPVIGRFVDRALFGGDRLIVVAKDNVVRLDRAVEPAQSAVLPSQLVEHFIESTEYHWIMDFCICRDSMQCQDYPAELGCLFLGEAAMHINPRLGRRVSREEALAHVRKCRELGLVHLIGRNKLDTVWLNVGPGERLLTICNCCPCCCLWRMMPHLDRGIAAKVHRMPGVSVRVGDDCIGCGTCADGVCYVQAIRLEDDRAVIGDDCKGCGRCVDVCPNEAIDLTVANAAFVTDAISAIEPLVDLSPGKR